MPSKIKFKQDTIAIFVAERHNAGDPVTYAVSVPALVHGDYAITPELGGVDYEFELYPDRYVVTHIESTLFLWTFDKQSQARKYIETLVKLLGANPKAKIVKLPGNNLFTSRYEFGAWKPNDKFSALHYQAKTAALGL